MLDRRGGVLPSAGCGSSGHAGGNESVAASQTTFILRAVSNSSIDTEQTRWNGVKTKKRCSHSDQVTTATNAAEFEWSLERCSIWNNCNRRSLKPFSFHLDCKVGENELLRIDSFMSTSLSHQDTQQYHQHEIRDSNSSFIKLLKDEQIQAASRNSEYRHHDLFSVFISNKT